MLKQILAAARAARRAFDRKFAPIIVGDDLGTKHYVWSFAAAQSWLPACYYRAVVIHRRTGRVLATRYQFV